MKLIECDLKHLESYFL